MLSYGIDQITGLNGDCERDFHFGMARYISRIGIPPESFTGTPSPTKLAIDSLAANPNMSSFDETLLHRAALRGISWRNKGQCRLIASLMEGTLRASATKEEILVNFLKEHGSLKTRNPLTLVPRPDEIVRINVPEKIAMNTTKQSNAYTAFRAHLKGLGWTKAEYLQQAADLGYTTENSLTVYSQVASAIWKGLPAEEVNAHSIHGSKERWEAASLIAAEKPQTPAEMEKARTHAVRKLWSSGADLMGELRNLDVPGFLFLLSPYPTKLKDLASWSGTSADECLKHLAKHGVFPMEMLRSQHGLDRFKPPALRTNSKTLQVSPIYVRDLNLPLRAQLKGLAMHLLERSSIPLTAQRQLPRGCYRKYEINGLPKGLPPFRDWPSADLSKVNELCDADNSTWSVMLVTAKSQASASKVANKVARSMQRRQRSKGVSMMETDDTASDCSGSGTNTPDSDKSSECIVESIVAERRKGKSIEYCVKWQGFGDDENTWESREKLDRCTALDDWEASQRPQAVKRKRR